MEGKGVGFSWSRAVGEFLVIVIGVLVALAADAWNDARLDRLEEQEYLNRLRTDIQDDTAGHRFILGWMDRKEASLTRLRSLLAPENDAVPDSVSFLSDLAAAANFGWNVGPLARRATYEDLRSSGKLGLIQDPGLRSEVIEYYELAEAEDRRIQARSTEYPHIHYRLVPSSTELEPGTTGGSEMAETEDIEALFRTIRASELPSHILAERNRARFIRNSITSLRSKAIALLRRLEGQLKL